MKDPECSPGSDQCKISARQPGEMGRTGGLTSLGLRAAVLAREGNGWVLNKGKALEARGPGPPPSRGVNGDV